MKSMFGRGAALVSASCAAMLFLSGCSTKMVNPAPVEDRDPGVTAIAPPVDAVQPGPLPPSAQRPSLSAAENAGKPGYYTVKPGDTLIRIGLETGQNWRDVAR